MGKIMWYNTDTLMRNYIQEDLMKKISKNILCLVMALCMVLSLAACGGKAEDKPGTSGKDEEAVHPDFVYKAEFTPIDVNENEYIRILNVSQDGVYCAVNRKVGTEVPDGAKVEYEGQYDVYKEVLCLMSPDGTLTELSGYTAVPEEDAEGRKDFSSGATIVSLVPKSDGTIIDVESIYSSWYEGPENITVNDDNYWDYQKYENAMCIRVLDKDGAELSSAKMTLDENSYMGIDTVGIDQDGNVIMAIATGLIAVAPDGTTAYTIDLNGNYVDRIIDKGNGEVYISYFGDNGPALALVDSANKKLGEDIEIPDRAYDVRPGGGDYDFAYTNGLYLYGFNIGEEPVKLLNWMDADVNSDDIRYFAIDAEGNLTGISQTYNRVEHTRNYDLLKMTKQPYDSVPHKEELTLAVLWLDQNIKEQIIKYNRSSDKYRIVIKDYSEFNTEDDWSAGETKLTTEIMSGELPDILSMNGMPYNQLAAKGLIEDIYPYIDADAELKREDFQQSFFKAMEVDGKLCQVIPSFSVVTALGSNKVVGGYDKWTYDEFNDALSKMPEGCMPFGPYADRASILQMTISMDINMYADWTTGECHFDSPEFIELLNFAKMFPETINTEPQGSDTELIKQGLVMLMPTYVSDFDSLQYESYAFGNDARYIGIPSAGGGGSAFTSDCGYAITKDCANKDAAWDFLRTLLTEKYQKNLMWGLPTNVHAFDAKLKDAMTPDYETDADGNFLLDEEGNKIEISHGGMMDENGNQYDFYALTEEQAAEVRSLIDNTTKVLDQNSKIGQIVVENAAAFFSGQKSAEEVAKLIQSKANIYINEQR